MSDKKDELNVGDDSVVVGKVSGNVGDRSVVVGATDDKGNTILNEQMALGYGAKAGSGSIAIGAGAGAGVQIEDYLYQIKDLIDAAGDSETLDAVTKLIEELRKPQKDESRIIGLWDTVKASASLSGAVTLVNQISDFIAKLGM